MWKKRKTFAIIAVQKSFLKAIHMIGKTRETKSIQFSEDTTNMKVFIYYADFISL